jgi:hypothetical protein
MAILQGKQSTYLLENKLKHKYQSIFAFGVIAIAYFIYLFFSIGDRFSWTSFIWVGVPFFIIFLILRPYVDRHLHSAFSYKKGMKGEEQVLKELLKLSDEFILFHSVHLPNQRADIDFVLLSSSGIYTIEVKNINGTIEFNGGELMCDGKLMEGKSVVAQVRNQYWGLHNYLKEFAHRELFIKPIIVFVNGNVKYISEPQSIHKEIEIMKLENIYRYFVSRPQPNTTHLYDDVRKILQELTL